MNGWMTSHDMARYVSIATSYCQGRNVLVQIRAGFEPVTYGYLHVPLQSTALPTELPEDGGRCRIVSR